MSLWAKTCTLRRGGSEEMQLNHLFFFRAHEAKDFDSGTIL